MEESKEGKQEMAESRLAKLAAHITGRGSKAGFRVAVLGASGGIGT